MADREAALRSLVGGNIFHAESPNGASLICLVTSVTETTIFARTVTTQICLEFDRQTGTAKWGDESALCTIDSTRTLPAKIYDVMLQIDRKFGVERDLGKFKLLDTEIEALLFVDSYYASNIL
jgi:hypothetical protein